jgi:hypothetical protein
MNDIQNECASCTKVLMNTMEHYEMYGNYCLPCMRKIDIALESSKAERQYAANVRMIRGQLVLTD